MGKFLAFVGGWLLEMVWPLIKKALVSLGLTLVTLSGIEIGIDQLKSALTSSTNSLPADILQLFLLAGGGICLNIIFAAINFRIAIWSTTRSTKLSWPKSSKS